MVRSLHITSRPQTRQAILSGTFQQFPCPSCGHRVRVEPTLLYTDFERYHWFAVFPRRAIQHRSDLIDLVDAGFERNMRERCAPMVRQWAPRFSRRVVFGLPLLREKLLCAAHDLSDRVLEAVKMQLLRESAPRCFHPRTLLYLDRIGDDRLELILEEPPGQEDRTQIVRRLGVPMARYAQLRDWPERAHRLPELQQPWLVDWRASLHPDCPLPRTKHTPIRDFSGADR